MSSTVPLTVSMTYVNAGQVQFYGNVPGGQAIVLGGSGVAGATDEIVVSEDASRVSVSSRSSGSG
jgi:hypothetical protein